MSVMYMYMSQKDCKKRKRGLLFFRNTRQPAVSCTVKPEMTDITQILSAKC